ncbi:kinase-like domain-containing protein [Suillus discolor]|uniref:Kinase-like domain-containing protein n=1 Tax=Suillus discolor TaxID=1912936 RepID=A0A9P7F659_9AGAM|nr:kinase-like domain-containing protein [Suillus discolor]KAG2108211.1 kinase-like domain-containing protein [Suillus discolor]
MNKSPFQIDGRFRLENILGSGSYGFQHVLLAVVYCAQNFLNDDIVAIKLELVTNNPSSVEHEYRILKQLEGGVGDQLLSHLEYISSHGDIHGDVKLQNALIDNLEQMVYIIDFGIAKRYWNSSTKSHIPFCQGRCLTGTPAFASINNHLGLEPGRRDDLKSLAYMLIYFLRGSLPWLNSNHEKLYDSFILECKVDTAITDLCEGIPPTFANILVYSRSLSFSEDPDYDYLHSLLHDLCTTGPAPAMHSLDFDYPTPPSQYPKVSQLVPTCLPEVTPLRRSTRVPQCQGDSVPLCTAVYSWGSQDKGIYIMYDTTTTNMNHRGRHRQNTKISQVEAAPAPVSPVLVTSTPIALAPTHVSPAPIPVAPAPVTISPAPAAATTTAAAAIATALHRPRRQ